MKNKLFWLPVIAIMASFAVIKSIPVAAEAPTWTKGEVTKVDKELGKITIRHEEIKNLDMPAMRMIFRVADPKMLNKLEVGKKGEFYFVDDNGRMLIKQVR